MFHGQDSVPPDRIRTGYGRDKTLKIKARQDRQDIFFKGGGGGIKYIIIQRVVQKTPPVPVN